MRVRSPAQLMVCVSLAGLSLVTGAIGQTTTRSAETAATTQPAQVKSPVLWEYDTGG